MKRHIRFMTLVLALTLLATLTSCWLLEEPFGEAEETTRSYDDIPIGEIHTDVSSDVTNEGFPDIPADGTIPAETSPAEPDIRELWGTVVEYKAFTLKLIFLSASLKSTTFAVTSSPIFNTSAGFSTCSFEI